MSCVKWEELIADQMGGEFSAAVNEHLRLCPVCAALAEELEADRRALASDPPEAADADYAAMRREIRAAIVRQRRVRLYVPALAAAAALLAIAMFHPGARPAPPVRPGIVATARPEVAPPAPPAALAHAALPHAALARTARRRRVRRAESPRVDLALLRRVAGQETAPDTGSESPVEMHIATANPNVTIILLQEREGSYE